MKTSTGTVIMSNLNTLYTEGFRSDSLYSNASVRIGEVVEVFYPGEITKPTVNTETVYLVRLLFGDGNLPASSFNVYARLSSHLESQTDYIRHNLRPATKEKDGVYLNDGARVLVACASGDLTQAWIIGCVKQENRPDKKRIHPGKPNREFEAEINGVHLLVNDDGELSVEVKGSTDQEGNVESPNGSFCKFSKDGVITISDNGTETIRISRPDKKVEVKTDAYSVEGNTWSVKAKEATMEAQTVQVTAPTIQLSGQVTLGEGGSEPMVLGQKLVEALGQLVGILVNNAQMFCVKDMAPVQLSPAVAAQLSSWLAQNCAGAPPPILSGNSFTK